MNTLFEKFMNWIRPQKDLSQKSSAMTVQLLQTLAMTKEDELSCGDIYSLLDQFVEIKTRGDDVEKLMPMVKHHKCTPCNAVYLILLVNIN